MTVLYRALLGCLAILLFFNSSESRAAPTNGDLPLTNPCFLLGSPDVSPELLMRKPTGFNCKMSPRAADAHTVWVRYDLRGAQVDGRDGWVYDHAVVQSRNEQVWIQYADGRIRKSPTSYEAARRAIGGPTQRYAFTSEAGQITALLARIDGMENRRGPVPRASLTSAARTIWNTAQINLVFGVLAGIMTGILFYNLTLFSTLRYRVLVAYAGSIASTLLYGAVWSNLILLPFPEMTTKTQFQWNALSITLCFLATSAYFQAFVEPGKVPRWAIRSMIAASGMGVAAATLQLLLQPFSWRTCDIILYTSFIGTIAALIGGCVGAWRKGSVAVRYFLLAWTVPVAITFAKILWGIGNVEVESPLFDASPFISLSLEALLSAIALSWRLRQLRDERDEARDLAETDMLTGLLNRRAFTMRAFGGERPKRLVLIDIDHFKGINDSFGHQAGDDVLAHIGQVLRANSPDNALIGRLGGEEFAVLVRADAASSLAEGLRQAVASTEFPGGIPVTVSIGYAMAHVFDDASWRAIYRAADEALYDAKRDGRNRVCEKRLTLAA